MRDPVFRSGKVTTGYIKDFIERTPKELYAGQDPSTRIHR